MKKASLFAKYNQIIILVTLCIFLIASVAFYFTLNYLQLQQIDEDLKIEEAEIHLYIQRYGQLPDTFSVDDQIIEFVPVSTPFASRYFTRTHLADRKGEQEDFRQLVFGVTANGKWYKTTVSKSLEETNHLINSILWIASAFILIILIASLLINRFVLKKLWRPFFQTLDVFKDFKLNTLQKLKFPSTSTQEFELLINTLEMTTRHAKLDYLALKTFSENASHEIQTPIAIIRSKLDLLIQDEQLSEKQSGILQSIYDAIHKLSRLNSSLLLLAKIENQQYSNVEDLDMKELIDGKLAEFQELWNSQQIEVNAELIESTCTMDKVLAEVLVNNLLSNATNNNYYGGKIFINLQRHALEVANTSHAPMLDKQLMFQRFYKPNADHESNGLGLSIIKQICMVSNMKVSYHYSDQMHSFLVEWRT